MRAISVNVSDPIYRRFQEQARRADRPAAELIREAMEAYEKSWSGGDFSLRDLAPLSLGRVKAGAFSRRGRGLFGEMLDGRRA